MSLVRVQYRPFLLFFVFRRKSLAWSFSLQISVRVRVFQRLAIFQRLVISQRLISAIRLSPLLVFYQFRHRFGERFPDLRDDPRRTHVVEIEV